MTPSKYTYTLHTLSHTYMTIYHPLLTPYNMNEETNRNLLYEGGVKSKPLFPLNLNENNEFVGLLKTL